MRFARAERAVLQQHLGLVAGAAARGRGDRAAVAGRAVRHGVLPAVDTESLVRVIGVKQQGTMGLPSHGFLGKPSVS